MWTVTREEDLGRQRVNRSVLVGNGLILAGGGILLGLLLTAAIAHEAAQARSWEALLAWQAWGLIAMAGGLATVGIAMFRKGRRTILNPDPRIPSRAELPPDHPRNRLPLRTRQLRSLACSLGWIAGSAASIALAIGPLRGAGDWPRFLLFFVVPGVLMFASIPVHTHFTGERHWPCD